MRIRLCFKNKFELLIYLDQQTRQPQLKERTYLMLIQVNFNSFNTTLLSLFLTSKEQRNYYNK